MSSNRLSDSAIRRLASALVINKAQRKQSLGPAFELFQCTVIAHSCDELRVLPAVFFAKGGLEPKHLASFLPPWRVSDASVTHHLAPVHDP